MGKLTPTHGHDGLLMRKESEAAWESPETWGLFGGGSERVSGEAIKLASRTQAGRAVASHPSDLGGRGREREIRHLFLPCLAILCSIRVVAMAGPAGAGGGSGQKRGRPAANNPGNNAATHTDAGAAAGASTPSQQPSLGPSLQVHSNFAGQSLAFACRRHSGLRNVTGNL